MVTKIGYLFALLTALSSASFAEHGNRELLEKNRAAISEIESRYELTRNLIDQVEFLRLRLGRANENDKVLFNYSSGLLEYQRLLYQAMDDTIDSIQPKDASKRLENYSPQLLSAYREVIAEYEGSEREADRVEKLILAAKRLHEIKLKDAKDEQLNIDERLYTDLDYLKRAVENAGKAGKIAHKKIRILNAILKDGVSRAYLDHKDSKTKYVMSAARGKELAEFLGTFSEEERQTLASFSSAERFPGLTNHILTILTSLPEDIEKRLPPKK